MYHKANRSPIELFMPKSPMKLESQLKKVQIEVTCALYGLNIEPLLKICNELEIPGLEKERIADKAS